MHPKTRQLHDIFAPTRPALAQAFRAAGAERDHAALLADLAMASHAAALDALFLVARRALPATGRLCDVRSVEHAAAQLLVQSATILGEVLLEGALADGGRAVGGHIDRPDGSFTLDCATLEPAPAAE